MKKKYLIILLFIFLISCNSSNNEGMADENIVFVGEVVNITNESEGYVADAINPNDEVFSLVISSSNLQNTTSFEVFEIGDEVAVVGTELNTQNQLTVTKIISNNVNSFELSGIVEEVEFGIDGYSTLIKRQDGELFNVVISIPNLGENAMNYKDVEVGESIRLMG